MKAAGRPLYKKDERTEKSRSISILSNVSKIHERCLYNQMCSYFDKIFSRYQCGFRKGINTAYPFIMTEKMKTLLHNKQFCAAIPTGLPKAFDGILYDLPIAKLNANGFDQEVLKIINGYLCYISQKLKQSSSFSKELDTLCCVPQGSILGPLLFNVDICDLFFSDSSSDVANYVDYITPYECASYYD